MHTDQEQQRSSEETVEDESIGQKEQIDQFVSFASHELKTPITAIKGFAQLALRAATRAGDERVARMLKVIDEQSNRLTKMIDDLFEVSRLQSGAFALSKEVFDLREAIYQAMIEAETIAPGFSFNQDLPDTPIMVEADRSRVEKVIANLLHNALKYSRDKKRVEIVLDCKDQETCVSVRDFGVGIPKDQLTEVFERFFRASLRPSSFVRDRNTGLGLGLFISRGIVKQHGGRMWVESIEGDGSTFYFTLPMSKEL